MDIRCAPCEVCGSASTGFHFGVLACEGCKGFYRRTVKFNLADSYKCLTGLNECEVSIKSRKCQKCRYTKCVASRMASEASRTGRPTKVRQAEIRLRLEQLRTENRLLPAPTTLPPHLLQQQREKQQERAANKIAKKAAKKHKNTTVCVKERKPSTCGGASSVDAMETMTWTSMTLLGTDQVRSDVGAGSSCRSPTTTTLDRSAGNVDDSPANLSIPPAMLSLVAETLLFGTVRQRSESGETSNTTPGDPHSASSLGSEAAGSGLPHLPRRHQSGCHQFDPKRFLFDLSGFGKDAKQSQFQPHVVTTTKADRSTATLENEIGSPDSPLTTFHDKLKNIAQQQHHQQQQQLGHQLNNFQFSRQQQQQQQQQQIQQQKDYHRQQSSLSPDRATSTTADDQVGGAPLLISSPDASGLCEFVTPPHDITSLSLDQLTKIVREDSKSANPMLWLNSSGREWFNADLAALFGGPPIDDPYHLYRRYILPMQAMTPSPSSLSVPLSEPSPLSFLPSLLSVLTDRNLELTDVWRRHLSGFELKAVHMNNFVKSLPGFMHIDLQDRILLTTHAMMPLLYAQLSLDFDPNTETVNFFSMSQETAELFLLTYAGPDKLLYLDTFRRHFVDAGYAIKRSALTIVEFGLLCALIFFNPTVPGLKDMAKVETVRLELSHAAEAYVYGNFPSDPTPETGGASSSSSMPSDPLFGGPSGFGGSRWHPGSSSPSSDASLNMNSASQRIENFRSLVSYFRNLNLFASWLRGLTLQVHPYLVECSGQVFREMHLQMEHSIKSHSALEEARLASAAATTARTGDRPGTSHSSSALLSSSPSVAPAQAPPPHLLSSLASATPSSIPAHSAVRTNNVVEPTPGTSRDFGAGIGFHRYLQQQLLQQQQQQPPPQPPPPRHPSGFGTDLGLGTDGSVFNPFHSFLNRPPTSWTSSGNGDGR